MDPFGFDDYSLPSIKEWLIDDLKRNEDKIRTFPHAKNITRDDPNTWGGAFLVPFGVKKGRSPVNRFVYEEDALKFWKNIIFHTEGDPVLLYWNPDEITIYTNRRNIIQAPFSKIKFEKINK
jgi:hypothetical protein